MPIKLISVKIPAEIFDCVEDTAEALGISVDVMVAQTVFEAFKDKMLTRGIAPPIPPKHRKAGTK